MNLSAPCPPRGSCAARLGGPGAAALGCPPGPGPAAAAHRAERGRGGEGGRFSRPVVLVLSPTGEAPLPSHSSAEPPLPLPPAWLRPPPARFAGEALGIKETGTEVVSPPAPALPFAPQQPPASAPLPAAAPHGPSARPGGGDPRRGRPAVPAPGSPSPGRLQRGQRWLVLLETEERAPTPRRRGRAPGPAAAAVPGLDTPLRGLETARRPGAACERREGTGRSAAGRPPVPLTGAGGLCAGAAVPPALSKHSCCRCRRARRGTAGVKAAFTRPAALPSPPDVSSPSSPAAGASPGVSLSRDDFAGGSGARRRGGRCRGACAGPAKTSRVRQGGGTGTPLPPLTRRAPPVLS